MCYVRPLGFFFQIFKGQIRKVAYKIQNALEQIWPLPLPNSTLNVSVRDLVFGSLILFIIKALRRVHWILAVSALLYEPALLCFPFNVVHGIFVHTPRFWKFMAVEPKLQLLLNNFSAIKAEALEVCERAIPFSNQPHQRRIAQGQPWNTLGFTSYGAINYTNCALCPTLSSLILQIPSIKLAMLSIMEGGARIKRHCGYFKNVLRVHLTLHVDQPETLEKKRYINVGGEEYHWKEGDLVVFDDTFPHEVINEVPGKRIVLFLDIERPYDQQWMSLLSSQVLKFFQWSKTLATAAQLQEKKVELKG